MCSHRAGAWHQHAGSTTSTLKTGHLLQLPFYITSPTRWDYSSSYFVQLTTQLSTSVCYPYVELIFSQIWQSEVLSNCTREEIAKKNKRSQTARTSSFPLQIVGIGKKRCFQKPLSEFCKDWATLKDTCEETKLRTLNWKRLWTRKVRMTPAEP